MKKILPIFSYLFHPLFIPVYSCLFYFFVNENYISYSNLEIYLILFQVVIITFFIPLSFFYLLKSLGKIDTIMVSDLSQRKLPLIMQIILLFILIKKGTTIDRIPELYFYFLGGLLSTLVVLGFLFCKIKASIHMVGISSLLFLVIGLSFHFQSNFINTIVFLLVICGLVASSRLVMKAHTFKELIYGFLSGILPQIALWFLWL